MTYLLDTNVVSELRKGSRGDRSLIAWISTVAPKALYTSVLVIGELRRGIEGIRRRDARQAKAYEDWLEQVRLAFAGRILDIDERIAEEWGRLNVPDPLPAIDGLLAATSKVHGLTLATRNVADVVRTGIATIDPFKANAQFGNSEPRDATLTYRLRLQHVSTSKRGAPRGSA